MKPEEVIVEMKFGSHLYGTATPNSDTDYKAVYLPSGRDILLQRVKDVIVVKTKTNNIGRNAADDIDRETYALHKFLHLLAQGQTVALDMFFANESVITHRGAMYHAWLEMFQHREKLLSKQCKSFIGYCRQQANKYGIKGSRMHDARKAADFFSGLESKGMGRAKLFEFEDEIFDQLVDNSNHNEVFLITNPNGVQIKHFSSCNRKAPFTITVKEAARIYASLFGEYGKRALAAEKNEGIDWKALSHAVRVGTQALELLRTGHITMPRPDRKELLLIKTGQKDYSEVSERIVKLLEEVESAALQSVLPEKPDYKWIDDFVARYYAEQVK